jgi:core binding factor beta subunit
MSELPYRLSQGDHKVSYRARRDDARTELKEAIDRKYVHVLFTETVGGTELGFPLDESRSDLSSADWEKGEGSVHLEGELKLDGVPVRCVADIDLATVEGTGHLVILEESAAA